MDSHGHCRYDSDLSRLTPISFPTHKLTAPMNHVHARAHPDAETHDLTTWGGIHAGRVTAWAAHLDCTPEAVVQATDAVPPMMDTGTRPSNYESHERPTSPELRCIAWSRADVERVRAVV